MSPTEILKNEHRVIEQVLNCLERMAHDAMSTGRTAKQDARDAIDFLRNFADRCHHGKEEAQLFPVLEAKGFDRENGPTGVMCREHDEGRRLIRGMAEAVEAVDASAAERFSDFAQAYVEMLRVHIGKEDHCLFTMADQVLGAEDQAELMARFEHVEAQDIGEGVHERYLELANALADRYGVEKAQVACCGHEGAFACGHGKH